MPPVNRAALLTKTHRVLKKHYKPVSPDDNRTLLEHLLFACCLENATPEAAEKVYQAVLDRYFDLNEIRVTTVRELAEFMKPLPDAKQAATRLKGVLQAVFESIYSFDIDALKKQNIGAAIKTLDGYDGTTRFSVSYVTQASLGGHSIPINHGAQQALVVIGVVTEAESAKGKISGMERAIPKNKGIEFGSLLQQFGAALLASPYSSAIKNILLEIDPGCKDRLPKRPSKKTAKPKEEVKPVKKGKKAAPAEKATKKKAPSKATPSKATPAKKKAPAKAPPAKKKVAAKKKAATPAKKAPKKAVKKAPAKKKPPIKAKPKAATKKTTTKTTTKKKSSTKQLTKRKPR